MAYKWGLQTLTNWDDPPTMTYIYTDLSSFTFKGLINVAFLWTVDPINIGFPLFLESNWKNKQTTLTRNKQKTTKTNTFTKQLSIPKTYGYQKVNKSKKNKNKQHITTSFCCIFLKPTKGRFWWTKNQSDLPRGVAYFPTYPSFCLSGHPKKSFPTCAMVKVVAWLYWGDGKPPTFNDGILIMGPINPYGLGLMSLSPIIWK